MIKKIMLLFFCSFFISTINDPISAEQQTLFSPISYELQLLDWKAADYLIPRYSKFSIIDIETGKEFQVQRRAGSQHADVQPLTPTDTTIMKDIYNGKWSWKRRAIIVMIDDQWIAASMHGMPHGAGALKNNFPGHFCIHFLGSTTHKTDKMDLSHMLMVYKAAGILPSYLNQLNAMELVQSFIAGVKEQDEFILSYVSAQNLNWKKELSSLENIQLIQLKEKKTEEETMKQNSVQVEVEWQLYLKNKKPFKQHAILTLMRCSPLEQWKVVVAKDLFH
ncbi:hypothetical protein [Niallia sp. 01092]|uniref:hypothetical protein n=1 Tax=unclassified Niallia TaxID=2837522 RepID=UPI003FD64A1E